MNIYQKLLKVRIDLQNMNLKKSGNNKFAGYDYYELGDFLPAINTLNDGIGLIALVSFEKELAYLTITDTEKIEDKILFTSPMSTAALKGCHEVQNLGAVETYVRRYLYMTAFEIVEHDNVEPITGKKDTKEENKPTTTDNKPKTDSGLSGQPSELEKRATAIYFNFTGNKEGQYGKTKEQYKEMLLGYKNNSCITTDYGKKWTIEDIEFLENVIEEGELPF